MRLPNRGFVTKSLRIQLLSLVSLLLLPVGMVAVLAQGENIDPSNDDSPFAWGENVGWII